MKNQFYIAFLVLLLFNSCSQEDWVTNTSVHFFLESDNAVMPVFVNGNTTSKVFLVLLHGGPGYTSMEAYQSNESPFTQLQSDYALVYWEQRCAGSSKGNCDYNELSLDDYTKDLEKLITLLKYRYADDIQLFLIGHSWGGALGIQYLSKGNNQSNITGWIEIDGGHNIPRISVLEREMVNEVGARQISQGNFVNDWQRNMSEANNLDLSKTDDVFEMNKIASRSENLMRRADSVNSKITTLSLGDYFFSPIDFHVMQNNGQNTVDAIKEQIVQLDLTNETQSITIPTLMIWGEYDFRVPPTFAQEAFDNYGSLDKELVILNRSAHFPQWNEPNDVFMLIHDFVENYK